MRIVGREIVCGRGAHPIKAEVRVDYGNCFSGHGGTSGSRSNPDANEDVYTVVPVVTTSARECILQRPVREQGGTHDGG